MSVCLCCRVQSRRVIGRWWWRRPAQRSARILIHIFVFVGFVTIEIQTARVVHVAPMWVVGVADAALVAVVDLSISLHGLLEMGDGGSGSFALRDGLDVESGGAGLALWVPLVRDGDISRVCCGLGDGLASKATVLLSALAGSNLWGEEVRQGEGQCEG